MTRTSRAELLDKQIQAVALVRAGKSYDEIAKAVGYTNRGAAWRLVRNALQNTVVADVQHHRAIELARLDALQVAHWQQACHGDAKSAQIVLRVIDQRIRLLGLCEVATRVSGPISIVRPVV